MIKIERLSQLILFSKKNLKHYGEKLLILNPSWSKTYDSNYLLINYELLSYCSLTIKRKLKHDEKYELKYIYNYINKNNISFFGILIYSVKLIFKYLLISIISSLKCKSLQYLTENIRIIISSSNHLRQIENYNLDYANKNNLILDIDRPWKSMLGTNKINIFPLSYFIKNLRKFVFTIFSLLKQFLIEKDLGKLQIRILLGNLGKLLIYQYVSSKISMSQSIITTKNNYFDQLLFIEHLKESTPNLSTHALTHGIIEDPLYYNSKLLNLHVFGKFDKLLMESIGDYSNVIEHSKVTATLYNKSLTSNDKMLVILTAGEGINNKYIVDFLDKVQILSNKLELKKIIIRPHPRSNIKILKRIINKTFNQIDVELSDGSNIYEQISASKICVSMYSSILVEISATQIPLIVDLPKHLSPYGILGQIPENKTLEFCIKNVDYVKLLDGAWFNNMYFSNYSIG